MRTKHAEVAAPAVIPLHKPYIVGHELRYVTEAISSSDIAADGHFARRCARLLEERFGIERVLMTPSCTAALELAAMLCGLEPGDEVIMPSFTFVSTANAVVRLRARPVFVEVRPDTLNLDESRLEDAITARTKAIFPVHYGGVGCEMGPIMGIASAHGLRVVEDAAQAVGSRHQGRFLGSIGHLGAYSFHETKNLVSGEGGALCCNSTELIERAEFLRDRGTNFAAFSRGEAASYTWLDVGTAGMPNELACAFLYAQLELMDAINDRRRAIAHLYREGFSSLERRGHLRLPIIPAGCESQDHVFHIMLGSGKTRDSLMAFLGERGVKASFHFLPLHDSPMGRRFGYQRGDLPVTEDVASRMLRLPSFFEITESEQSRVIDLVARFFATSRPRTEAGGRPPSLNARGGPRELCIREC